MNMWNGLMALLFIGMVLMVSGLCLRALAQLRFETLEDVEKAEQTLGFIAFVWAVTISILIATALVIQ